MSALADALAANTAPERWRERADSAQIMPMSDDTSHPLARRTFVGGSVGLALVGCAGSAKKWEVEPVSIVDGMVELEINDYPELVTPGGMLALRPAGAKRPVLVQRLEGEEIRVLSLRCPHLGCTVRWDDEEQVLRCPCHGSRFDDRGTVKEGPAKESLAVYRSEMTGTTIRFEYGDD